MKKKIIIFGTGYYGRSVYRVCKIKNIKPIFFIDNNFKNLKKNFMGIKVCNPNILKSKSCRFDNIILSGRYINNMKRQLLDLNVDPKKIILWGKRDLRLDKKNFKLRNQDFVETIKYIVKYFNEKQIDFWIDAGSLLGLARNQELAEFSDVEILIHHKDINKIYYFLKKINTNKFIFKKNLVFYSTLLKKKLYQFIIYKKKKNLSYEPAIIEFNILVNKSKNYENIALKKDVSIFNWKQKKVIKYHNIDLPIIKEYKKYLRYIYGKSWNIKKNFYFKNN